MLLDELYEDVTILLNFRNIDGQNKVDESSYKAEIQTSGVAGVTTTDFSDMQGKLTLDGNGYLYVEDDDMARFSAMTNGVWTLETTISTSEAGNQVLFDFWPQDGETSGGYRLCCNEGFLHYVDTTGFTKTGTQQINDGGEHHIAAVFDGSQLWLLVDFVADGEPTTYDTSELEDVNTRFAMGGCVTAAEGFVDLTGYLRGIRLTGGDARYIDALPSEPDPPSGLIPMYPPGICSISGTITDASGDPVQRIVRAYRRSRGDFMAETKSRSDTGAYTLYLPKIDEMLVVVFDNVEYDSGDPLKNDIVARVWPGE